MVPNSFSVDFNFKVMVEPHEPDIAVATEDGHQCQVSGTFEAPLETFISSRRMGGIRSRARMAMKMRQEFVSKLLQANQQIVGRGHMRHNPHRTAALVRKF